MTNEEIALLTSKFSELLSYLKGVPEYHLPSAHLAYSPLVGYTVDLRFYKHPRDANLASGHQEVVMKFTGFPDKVTLMSGLNKLNIEGLPDAAREIFDTTQRIIAGENLCQRKESSV